MRPAARCSGRSALPRAFERRRRGAAAPPGGSARRGGAAAARASEPALARCSLLTPPPLPSAGSQSLSPTVRVAPRPPFPRKRRLSQPWPVRLARLPGLLRVPGGLLPSSGRGVHSARPQTSHLAGSLRARSPARPVRQPLHPRLRRLHCPSRPRPSRRSSSIPALRPPRRASSASLCTCASRASTTPRRARSPGGAGADGRLASAAEGPPGSGPVSSRTTSARSWMRSAFPSCRLITSRPCSSGGTCGSCSSQRMASRAPSSRGSSPTRAPACGAVHREAVFAFPPLPRWCRPR